MERCLPAYPLWIIDPMFSVWATETELNKSDIIFWTGKKRTTYGFIRSNGVVYSFLGNSPDAVPLKQERVEVCAYNTNYYFTCENFNLKVSFVSPLTPDNKEILSCPVCYTDYEVDFKGEKPADFSVSIILGENYCYNDSRAEVVGGAIPMNGYESAFMTRRRNLILSHAADHATPDWGDTFLAGDECFFLSETGLKQYLTSGKPEYINNEGEEKFLQSVNYSEKGFFMIGFDDRVAIFYFGEWLKTYFFKDGKTILDAFDFSRKNHESIEAKLETFDKKLRQDCDKIGKGYYRLACAAYRQAIGAHKLVERSDGKILFLSKECDSNGCIGTVDVSYPSMPLFLLYNPELVKGMLYGIFDFAEKPAWTFDFAPHDLGTYPYCCGQVYGVVYTQDKFSCGYRIRRGEDLYTLPMLYYRPAQSNIYDEKYQMPVEECGNVLIMTAAACMADGDFTMAKDNFHLLEKWVKYLEQYGLEPKNQLCTDDFAGHLANNINLAIKAVVGIRCFALIAEKLNKSKEASYYKNLSISYAEQMKGKIGKGIFPLVYDQTDTYSLKYNLLFDKLFGFGLFEQSILEQETDYYIEKTQRYGVPLDSRALYTKSDWILWCSALTDDKNKAHALYEPICRFLSESPTHLPFSDWFDTTNGQCIHFYNRTVQGGIFALLLKKSEIMKC